ncbi:MAG: BrnA antitoxin family protein [bacterium]
MKKDTITKQSHTDWAAIDQMKDGDIDFSDLPEVSPEKFAQAIVRKNLQPVQKKTQITLRLDTDVLDWFKDQGKGYQTRINALLKAYKEAHQRHH